MYKSRNNKGSFVTASMFGLEIVLMFKINVENMNFDVENMNLFPSHIQLGVFSLSNHNNFVSVQNKLLFLSTNHSDIIPGVCCIVKLPQCLGGL